MKKKIEQPSSHGIEPSKSKSLRERFAEESNKIELNQKDLEELIAALNFAAQCAGEQIASEADPYGDAGLTAKTTRIFHLIAALKAELEQLQQDLSPLGKEEPDGQGKKEKPVGLLKLQRKKGQPKNIQLARAKNIIGAVVVVLKEDLGCPTRDVAINEVKKLVKEAGLEFNSKTVEGWYNAVESHDPVLWCLRLLSSSPLLKPLKHDSPDPKKNLLAAAKRMIEKAD